MSETWYCCECAYKTASETTMARHYSEKHGFEAKHFFLCWQCKHLCPSRETFWCHLTKTAGHTMPEGLSRNDLCQGLWRPRKEAKKRTVAEKPATAPPVPAKREKRAIPAAAGCAREVRPEPARQVRPEPARPMRPEPARPMRPEPERQGRPEPERQVREEPVRAPSYSRELGPLPNVVVEVLNDVSNQDRRRVMKRTTPKKSKSRRRSKASSRRLFETPKTVPEEASQEAPIEQVTAEEEAVAPVEPMPAESAPVVPEQAEEEPDESALDTVEEEPAPAEPVPEKSTPEEEPAPIVSAPLEPAGEEEESDARAEDADAEQAAESGMAEEQPDDAVQATSDASVQAVVRAPVTVDRGTQTRQQRIVTITTTKPDGTKIVKEIRPYGDW